ncbi:MULTISPECIES: ROK family transcriptional regulator [Tsukamurella]|uniref:ROK family transcriptional regulator n=1 Tax=Tsukamurella strandjordii TaxID=147577 RepID=A0AA90N9E8_9ACTN|nr:MULTISPECIES: ROK family transcriptional regulator [Tsukamurella]MDP0397345.1 ROK family transcriptional regulator [Tsukamurella strandjordii]GIZ98775.1 sugar kinase [Tsukamurella sp. TY48]
MAASQGERIPVPRSRTAGTGAGDLLQLLRDGRPRTLADLVEHTGLSRSTVRTRVDALVGAGYLTTTEDGHSTGGRPAGRFAWNAHHAVVLAIDLGATHAVMAVLDLNRSVLVEHTWDRSISDGPEAVLDEVLEHGRRLLAEVSVPRLAGIGVGLPGPVEHATGRPTRPPIMPGWDGYDVVGHLGEFGAPVLVDNDANLMALGEHASTWPKERHLLFVKAATGIGSGIISEGVLNRGAIGTAGDLGHVALSAADDVTCHCGNTGCLEAVASGAAIIRTLRASGMPVVSISEVVEAVRRGDPAAATLVRQAGRDIGTVLATCVSLLNPSVIVIGGELAAAGESLLAGVREVVYRRSIPLATSTLRIVASETGYHAGVIGAAEMVIDRVFASDVVDSRILNAAS